MGLRWASPAIHMTPSDHADGRAERIAESVEGLLGANRSSRRRFLGRSALAGGSLLALGGTAGLTVGREAAGADGAPDVSATFDDVEGTDLDVLQYALTLENLENAFYEQGLEMFDQDDFESAEIVQNYSTETDQTVRGYLETIGSHESAHVDVLTQAVALLGGDTGDDASYDFGVESVADFLALGQVLENTGVAAYAGAGPFIESPDLVSVALSIHSVEARHAAFLNDINGKMFFPNAFDPPKSQQEVLDAVSGFIE